MSKKKDFIDNLINITKPLTKISSKYNKVFNGKPERFAKDEINENIIYLLNQ